MLRGATVVDTRLLLKEKWNLTLVVHFRMEEILSYQTRKQI